MTTAMMTLVAQAREAQEQGNAPLALALLTQALTLDSNVAEIWRERGQLRLLMGDRMGATADMEQALRLNPELLSQVSGEFEAKGQEQCHSRSLMGGGWKAKE